ncbi:MAG: peptidase M14, partial [Thalassobius sp.]|nr:peptidase M14 [Thalassovita sp.]
MMLASLMLLGSAASLLAQKVPSPEDVYGFKVGTDYKLADYDQIQDYLEKLDQASDRIKKIEIGTTVLGRPMYLMFISTKENLDQLDKWKDI